MVSHCFSSFSPFKAPFWGFIGISYFHSQLSVGPFLYTTKNKQKQLVKKMGREAFLGLTIGWE